MDPNVSIDRGIVWGYSIENDSDRKDRKTSSKHLRQAGGTRREKLRGKGTRGGYGSNNPQSVRKVKRIGKTITNNKSQRVLGGGFLMMRNYKGN